MDGGIPHLPQIQNWLRTDRTQCRFNKTYSKIINLRYFLKTTEINDDKQQPPKSIKLFTLLKNVLVRVQACVWTHNQDEQKPVQSLAVAPASPAMTPQCHVPHAMACSMARQCQPQQSSETRKCKPAQYQCALLLCDDSNRGTSVSEDTPVQLIGPPGNSHFPALLLTRCEWCTKPTAVKDRIREA